MPIMLKRKDGSITRFRNAEFIPAFYILPKSIIDLCGTECQVIPRNPKLLLASWDAIKFVESDLFLEIIMDSYHYLIWPFMMPGEKREIYSGYEPAWRLSYAIPMWLKGFTDAGYLPTAMEFLQNAPYAEIGYVSEEELSAVLSVVVPRVMAENNLQPIIDIAKKYRCFEDFDYRSSRQKTDFYRQWYHTRTKHPLISLECFMEDYAESHDGEEWEIHDETQDFEEHVLSEIEVNRFLETLTDKDRQILELRMKGQPLEEIAEKLGYKTHSAVLKRIRKIGKAYEKYAGVDYGFSEKKIV